MSEEHTYAGVGTASLSADLSDAAGESFVINGIAIGEGDVTFGESEEFKYWSKEALQDAEGTLTGRPLVVNHENSAEGKIGVVTKDVYRSGVGILYEAEIAPHYEEYAKDVKAGILDVSPRIYHPEIEELDEHEETGAYYVDTAYFDNLSLVDHGAAPSNTAEFGEATHFASGPQGNAVAVLEEGASRPDPDTVADIVEEFSQHEEAPDFEAQTYEDQDWVKLLANTNVFGRITWIERETGMLEVDVFEMVDGELMPNNHTMSIHKDSVMPMEPGDVGLESLPTEDEEMENTPTDGTAAQLADMSDLSEGTLVRWDSSGDRDAYGKVVETRGEDDEPLDSEIDGDQTITPPAVLIEVHRPGEDGWEATETMVGHKPDELTVIDELPNAENLAEGDGDGDSRSLDEVYSEWQDHVNMSASELEQWANNPCAQEASKDPQAVISRNLELLETPKDEWTDEHIEDAERTISFISRMSDEANKPDAPMDGAKGCPTDWAISLLNWAFNPFDSVPDQPEEGPLAEEDGYDVDELSVTTGDTPSEGKEFADDGSAGQLPPGAFETRKEAMDKAEEIGCEDVHTHDMDGGRTIYMPCESMEKFREMVDASDLSVHTDEEEASEYACPDCPDDTDVEQLQDISMHEPEWDGKHTGEWDSPDLEDFLAEMEADAESWDDLTEDQRSTIADHFMASKSGFPPENFGDLALPVVEPDGRLSESALVTVKTGRGAQAVEGMSDEQVQRAESMANDLLESEFDHDTNEDESEEASEPDTTPGPLGDNVAIAQLRAGSAGTTTAHVTPTMKEITYNDASEDDVEELSEPVVVERDDLEALREEADDTDELHDELESLREEVGEQSDARELVEELSDDATDTIRDADDVTVVEADEFDELTEAVEEVSELYAEELAEHSPFEAEELTEKFGPRDLKARVDDHEAASLSATIEDTEPEPDAGNVEDELDETPDEAEAEEMEAATRDAVASLYEERLGWESQADKIREGEIGLDELDVDVESIAE